jgi:para-nitrobenzyl esterase
VKNLSKLLSALVCSAAMAGPGVAQVVTPIAPIQTGSGAVAGKVLDSGVKVWLGIPFAKPPVQDLRWEPPQPVRWQGVWNADRKMPECIQVLRPHNINHYFGEEPTSENCLYMNIWAPGNSNSNSKLPVIVFIYGGGSTIGSSGIDLYGGETMAKRGAVFVNFNYRLGILGFMAHPELTKEQGGHSGDYAYLDQNAALRWIHENIAKFGGDPDKVVIMGQSAGAGSVIEQTFSPLSKGLFRGAVMSSGCNWGTSRDMPLAEAEKIGLDIQKRLGAADLADMRNVPADKILALQNERQVGANVTNGVRVGGVIDGYFMPKTQMEILKDHQINDVPIIASFNHDEAASPLSRAQTVAEYQEIAVKLYGKDADAFLKLYPVGSVSDIQVVAGEVARESGLEKNARQCAMFQTQYDKSKAYIDTYSRKHPYAPGVKIADQDPATIGAYHTADIPYWFGTQDAFNELRVTRNWTPWDRELSQRMSAMLIAFANTGDPSTARDKWPAWSPKQEVKLEFNDAIKVVPLNVEGIEWLATHPARHVEMGPPGAGVLGNRIGNGPRD